MQQKDLNKIVSLARRRGFVFGGSEIHGGLSSVWDYGPLGALIKKKLKDIWWNEYVIKREDIVGLDSAIIMNENVFRASGHLEGFTDLLVDCPQCKKRFRIDKIKKIKDDLYRCPDCGSEIDASCNKPRKFNLMLKTNMSASEEDPQYAYLRPETAQGIFTNYLNVLNSLHRKLPFGIAQIGKAFRNEVTTGSFIFRMKEFEQMEIEYFTFPQEADAWYQHWVDERYRFYKEILGLDPECLRLREHEPDELAHYARACTDVEYYFPFGWSELEGIANRTDYDLSCHSRVSKKDMQYFDQKSGDRFIPYVIEPSSGVDRMFFAVFCDSYHEEEVKGRTRVVMKLKPELSPYTAAVFPLLKKNSDCVSFAKNIYNDIKKDVFAVYDDSAAIGKLYRRQDEIGTPFCITVDVQSLEDRCVTVRERDSMEQSRISAEKVNEFISDKLIRV